MKVFLKKCRPQLRKSIQCLLYLYIRAHSSVSVAKKTKEDTRHTGALFTGTIKLPNSAFRISKTTKPISTKFTYFWLTYTLLNISKLKEVASARLEIFVPENCPIFSHFSSFSSHKITNIFKSHKNNLPYFDFVQIWNNNKTHLGLNFLEF